MPANPPAAKDIREARCKVSGIRITLNHAKWLQVVDESGAVWALVPYSDITMEAHRQSHADAQTIADALNATLQEPA